MDYKQVELSRQTIFKDAVLSQAEARSMEIIAKASKKRADDLQQLKETSETVDYAPIKARLALEKERDLSAAEQRYRKELLEHRALLVSQLFEKIKTRLQKFTQTEGYKDFLLQTLKKHQNFVAEAKPLHIFLRPEDLQYQPELEKAVSGCKIEQESRIEIGGIKISSGNILFDETLDEALAQQKEEFYTSGKLTL